MQRPLIAGAKNQSHLRAILVWPDSFVLVNAPASKVEAAIQSGARTAAEFKDFGLGKFATIRGGATSTIERMTVNRGSGQLRIWFKKESGKTDSVEADVKNAETREKIIETLGSSLTSRGLSKSVQKASALIPSIMPMFTLGMVILVGGVLTATQASDGVTDLEPDVDGYGRSARRARGAAVLLNSIGNLLGFTGCLVATILLSGATLLVLLSRWRNRPEVLTFQ